MVCNTTEQNSKKTILILGYYGNANTGDEAILSCMLNQLRDIYPDMEFCVLSGNTDFTSKMHKTASLPNILPSNYVRYIIGMLGRNRVNFINTLNRIKESSALIVVGGGLFFDKPAKNKYLLEFLGKISWMKKSGKTINVIGVGVGPLYENKSKIALRKILNTVDLITVRDNESKEALNQIGVSNPETYITGDIAILLEPSPSKQIVEIMKGEKLTADKNPVIAISIRGSDVQNPMLKKSIIKFCRYATEQYNAQIWFFPFQFSGNDDDRPGIRTLENEFGENNNVFFLYKEKSPMDILGLFSKADIVIGERFHSIIFSIIAQKPFIGISYLPKVERLFSEIGHKEWCVNLDNIDEDSLIKRFDNIWIEKDEIKLELADILISLRKKALLNFEILSKKAT
ncbi:MAG: polysaccharide pyruvyl transferase family protein [candidate division Zixibacteria bacterium]|nr:polysaccharide pyruvyl transferase family protein [candidate division Zixibacteria bacterium]